MNMRLRAAIVVVWYIVAIVLWAGAAWYLSPEHESLHNEGLAFRHIAIAMFSLPFAVLIIYKIRQYFQSKPKRPPD